MTEVTGIYDKGQGMSTGPLDPEKARKVFPLGNPEQYNPTVYLPKDGKIALAINQNEAVAVLAAYDYGIHALSDEGLREIERVIASLKVAITGR